MEAEQQINSANRGEAIRKRIKTTEPVTPSQKKQTKTADQNPTPNKVTKPNCLPRYQNEQDNLRAGSNSAQIHTKLPQSPRRSSSSPETNNKERALIKVIGTHARDLSTPWHQPRATQRPAPSHHHSRHEGVAPVAALLERGQTFAIVIGLPSIKPLLCFAFSLLSLLCLSFIPLPHFSFLVSRATTALSAYTSFQEPNSQPKRPLPIFQQGHSVDFYPRFHG